MHFEYNYRIGSDRVISDNSKIADSLPSVKSRHKIAGAGLHKIPVNVKLLVL